MSELNDIDSTFALVDAVKKYRILYDSSTIDYHIKHKHDTAWKEVGKEMNAPAVACKEKWKNLRAAFSRHRRQQIAYEMGGKARKPYYLAECMSFLIPHTNVKLVNSANYSMTSHNIDQIQDDHEETIDIKEERIENWSNSTDDNEPGKFVTTGICEMDKSSSVFGSVEEDKTEEEGRKEDKTEKHCFTCQQNDNNADLNFLKSLLPDMRQMNQRKKNQFKIAILKTLQDFIDY